MLKRLFNYSGLFLLGSCLLLSCSSFEVLDSGPEQPVDVSQVADAIPQVERLSPYGNPSSYEQDGITYHTLKSAQGYQEQGIASWYGTKFHGERTSSGELYDMYQMTAAHKTMPLPSYARVTNLENSRVVVVKVNDRGPFKSGRIIDLSYAAAVKLGFHHRGTAEVMVEAIVPEGSHSKVGPSVAPENKDIYVQVGAFSDQKKARRLVDAIQQELSWTVAISKIRVNRKRLYRVRIGPIETLDGANQLVDTLTMPELGTPKIVFE